MKRLVFSAILVTVALAANVCQAGGAVVVRGGLFRPRVVVAPQRVVVAPQRVFVQPAFVQPRVFVQPQYFAPQFQSFGVQTFAAPQYGHSCGSMVLGFGY